MSITNVFRPCHGKAEFERHIEARGLRLTSIQFNSRQVVKRVLTGSQQVNQPIHAPLASGNLQDSLGNQAKPAQAGNKGQIQRLKLLVKGNIQEGKKRIGL